MTAKQFIRRCLCVILSPILLVPILAAITVIWLIEDDLSLREVTTGVLEVFL